MVEVELSHHILRLRRDSLHCIVCARADGALAFFVDNCLTIPKEKKACDAPRTSLKSGIASFKFLFSL